MTDIADLTMVDVRIYAQVDNDDLIQLAEVWGATPAEVYEELAATFDDLARQLKGVT
jgi:hypothetical protein